MTFLMTLPEWFGTSPGSSDWWAEQQKQGIPRIERWDETTCRITFLWRDPAGGETTSDCQRVWINITGVTDHHQPEPPCSLQRFPGSDLWYWQVTLPSDWRGSYCLIPSDSVAAPQSNDAPEVRRLWWREQFCHAIADPLNPLRCWQGGRGMSVSALHLPDAPPQPEWQDLDLHRSSPLTCETLIWKSDRLRNQRRVGLLETGASRSSQRPLVVILDGQFWLESMPIAGPLQTLTDQQQLPAAIYLFIDTIDREYRSRELPCNPVFWEAVREELLPMITAHSGWQPSAERTLIAGESFGGLSAVYAVLNWPHSFGQAVSLSGSFWWPSRGEAQGLLIQQLAQQAFADAPRRLWLEAGKREPGIFHATHALYQRLQQQGITSCLTEIEGGHDALCWRGGLLNGLRALLNTPFSSPLAHHGEK